MAPFEFAVLIPLRLFASGLVCAAAIVEQHCQLEPGDLLVRELRALILGRRDKAARRMRRPDGAVGLVDMLPARPGGAES
jgi:hypothetical protein